MRRTASYSASGLEVDDQEKCNGEEEAVLRRRVARGVVAAGAAIAVVALTPSGAAGEQRAYELVTPPDSRAQIEAIGSFTSVSGDLAVFTSFDSFGEAVPNGPWPTADSFTARRTPDGWVSWWSTDLGDSEPGTLGSRTMFSTDDGLRQIFQTENAVESADTAAHSNDAVLREALPGGGRAITWLTPGARPSLSVRSAVAASSDLRRILVETEAQMTSDDTNIYTDLYLIEDGRPTRVTRGAAEGGRVSSAGWKAVPGTMSDDGSYVYFATSSRLVPEDRAAADADFYRWSRADGSVELVSPSLRPDGPVSWGPSPALLGVADDDRVCFETENDLVAQDDDWNWHDVYCYRRSTDELEQISTDGGRNEDFPSFSVAMSKDGSSVFFATEIELTPDDSDGTFSLYVRRDGTTRYVSKLEPADVNVGSDPEFIGRAATRNASWRGVRVSDDGTEMVFITGAAATTADRDTRADLYHWSVDDGLTLISAGDGRGETRLGASSSLPDYGLSENHVSGRVVTGDFGTVYFTTTDSLVGADTDGGYADVYEWSRGGGARLLSPAGDAPYNALYMDSTPDGASIFFVTAEPILPQDVNATRDLYVARAGGGSRLPVPLPPCSGDSCQGPLPSPPVAEQPGSAWFTGPGDEQEAEPVEGWTRLVSPTAAERRSLVRRGRATLRVKVSEGGLVGVRVTARIGKRNVPAATTWKQVTKKGTVRIPVQLAPRVRAALRAKKRVRLTISVTHSKQDDAARKVVVLRG